MTTVARVNAREGEGAISSETRDIPLPIFAYGTLQGEGAYASTGKRTTLLGRFVVRGVSLGVGDRYPCADITHDMSDITHGDGIVLRDTSREALDRVDDYEGVDGGYYRRCIIFASPECSPNLFVPMWMYVRGESLRSER